MDISMAISNQANNYNVVGYKTADNLQARDFAQEIININKKSSNVEFSKDIEIGTGFILKSDLVGSAILSIKSIGIDSAKHMILHDVIRDITWGLTYDADGRQRSIIDTAKLFEEESVRLEDMDGITDEMRNLVRYNLEKGFVEATRRFIQESCDGTPYGTAWSMDSVNNFARNVINNIQASNLDDKTKNLMLEGLNEVVSFRHSHIYNHKAMDVMGNFINRAGIRTLTNGEAKAISNSLMKEYNEKYRQQRDEYKTMLLESLNKFAPFSSSVDFKIENQNENNSFRIHEEDNADEEFLDETENPDLSINSLDNSNISTENNT